jgi:hypothetical protein
MSASLLSLSNHMLLLLLLVVLGNAAVVAFTTGTISAVAAGSAIVSVTKFCYCSH